MSYSLYRQIAYLSRYILQNFQFFSFWADNRPTPQNVSQCSTFSSTHRAGSSPQRPLRRAGMVLFAKRTKGFFPESQRLWKKDRALAGHGSAVL